MADPVGVSGDLLDAAITVPRRDFDVVADLRVAAGSVLAVLGPNGAGKSTLLRALAGLTPLREGHIRLDGTLLNDARQRIAVRAEARPVGLVFQDYLLFPHMSARENVAFGLRARGVRRSQATATADRLLTQVGLGAAADARPGQLSGGQAQRVALARALAVQPTLLLLDEPLAALDTATRSVIRGELRRQLGDFAGATVLVTHDPLDALVLADTMVVLEAGRVVQRGAPAEVARRPRTDYVAAVMGINLLAGHADGTRVRLDGGGQLVVSQPVHGDVHVAVRPAAIALYGDEPLAGSPRNRWRGSVVGVEQRGNEVRVSIAGPPDVMVDVTAAALGELRLTPGMTVWCAAKATEIDAYPR